MDPHQLIGLVLCRAVCGRELKFSISKLIEVV